MAVSTAAPIRLGALTINLRRLGAGLAILLSGAVLCTESVDNIVNKLVGLRSGALLSENKKMR